MVPVSEITRLYARDKADLTALTRIVTVAALPDDWRDYFEEQLSRVTARAQQSERGRTGPGMARLSPVYAQRESARE